MEVCDRVIGHKHRKNAGVGWRIGVCGVADLKVHLKGPSTFISAKFHPNFLRGDYSAMASKLVVAIIYFYY